MAKLKLHQKENKFLELSPSELTSPILTAQWEEKLMLIEKGNIILRNSYRK